MKISLFFKISFISMIWFLGSTIQARAQQATASSGGQLEGSTRQISFTVGEAAIKTLQGQNLMLTQGFQQPRLWVTALNEVKGLAFKIRAYPNPTSDYLKLSTEKPLPSGTVFQLFDINGRQISENQPQALLTEIAMQQVVPGTYLLKVVNKQNVYQTFKIIKK